jgi:hypothetical protein
MCCQGTTVVSKIQSLLMLVGLEERPVRHDVEALAEPCANELAVDDLCLPEALGREVAEAADRVNDIVEVEHGNRSAGRAEAFAERARNGALARSDGSKDHDEVRHATTLARGVDPVRQARELCRLLASARRA